MRLSSIVLSVAGFVYALLGFLFLFAPVTMGRWILLSVPSAAAAIEIRAFYGGLEVGLGAFLLYCGNRPATVIVGLVAMTLCTGGILVGRLTGIFLDGSPEKMTLVSMIVELFTTVTGILLLMDEGRRGAVSGKG